MSEILNILKHNKKTCYKKNIKYTTLIICDEHISL